MKTAETVTPYEALGGEVGIQRLVHRFYELMDELPEAYTVRQLHPASLDGSATSLFETFAQMANHLIHTDGAH